MRFTLLFDALEPVHLHKDVGQIPYQLQKQFGYESEIVYGGNKRAVQAGEELAGLKIRHADRGMFAHLFSNSSRIDVLMLFHVKTSSIYYALLYKYLNPNGIVYVKYDLDDTRLLYAEPGNRNMLTQFKRSLLFGRFLKCLDILSVECLSVHEKLEKIPASKLIRIPNGFDPDLPGHFGVSQKPFDEKEDIILLVGRHGSRQKNSELMLAALEEIGDIGQWQVLFAGPVTDEFNGKFRFFLEKHPRFSGKVRLLGNLENKKELFEYYNRSKILCLPSRWESWGLVCGEALCFGNVIVMTREIPSSRDLTKDGEVGFLAGNENIAEWGSLLNELMGDQERLRRHSRLSREHFTACFVWRDVLKVLTAKIEEVASASP